MQRIGLLIAMAALALGSALQAGDTTKLSIHVVNDSDKPVDRASVIVRFVEGRSYIKLGHKIRNQYELRTNQDGMASIPEIPQGKILIQIIAKGYQTFGQNYDIGDDEKTVEIKLNPPQQQYSAHPPLKQ